MKTPIITLILLSQFCYSQNYTMAYDRNCEPIQFNNIPICTTKTNIKKTNFDDYISYEQLEENQTIYITEGLDKVIGIIGEEIQGDNVIYHDNVSYWLISSERVDSTGFGSVFIADMMETSWLHKLRYRLGLEKYKYEGKAINYQILYNRT
jgi:hypothetical protein